MYLDMIEFYIKLGPEPADQDDVLWGGGFDRATRTDLVFHGLLGEAPKQEEMPPGYVIAVGLDQERSGFKRVVVVFEVTKDEAAQIALALSKTFAVLRTDPTRPIDMRVFPMMVRERILRAILRTYPSTRFTFYEKGAFESAC